MWRVTGVCLSWTCAHYFASHLYTYMCVPATLSGFLMSPFITPAPHCVAIRWVITNGGSHIGATWLLLGAWAIKSLRE